VISLPVDRRTRHVLRSAEFGFLGFVMPTLRQTPLRAGAWTSESAGETALRARLAVRQPCGERGISGGSCGKKDLEGGGLLGDRNGKRSF
jgi:hypothetical protein